MSRILAGIGEMLEARPFDPATATGRLRLLMTDLHAVVLAPHLLARLAREASALDLDILAPGPALFAALESDATDAVVGVIDEAPAGIIVVSVTGVGPAPVDEMLSAMGRTRRVRVRVRVRVPNLFSAVEIAAQSDLVMTLPASLARTAAGMGRFVTLPPPVDPGRFALSLLWHARHQDAPRHVWLRQTIVAAATEVSAVGDIGRERET